MIQKKPPRSDQFELFQSLMRDYGAAWDNYSLARILDYYHTPCFVFKAQRVFFHPTDEAKRNYFSTLLDHYRDAGVDHSDIPELHVLPMGDNSAIVTANWVSRSKDGAVIWDFRDSYHWIRMAGDWRILGDTVHEGGYSNEIARTAS